MWVDRILDALTANTPAESVDVLVTWIGAATLIRYLVVIGRRSERSALEHRASFLIGVLAALCLIRGFSWLRPDDRWLGVLMLVPGALIPLALTLFAEGLLRRHLPVWVKGLGVTLTVVALLTDVASGVLGRDDVVASYTLVVAQLAMMAVLGLALARRDEATLSRAENALVQSCLFVTLLGIPLAVTDYRFLLGYPPARLGTLAILLFCYTLVRRPDEHVGLGRWARDLGRLVVRAGVVCLVILLALRTAPRELLFPQFVLATAVIIAFRVEDRLGQVNARRNGAALLRWLARPPARTQEEFARELHHLPLTADALLLDEADLTPYDQDALRMALGSGRPVRSLPQLRSARDAHRGTGRQALAARGADELTDLLERSDMTHVALITAAPLRLLLANVPALPGAEDAEVALAAVVRRAPQSVRSPERVLA